MESWKKIIAIALLTFGLMWTNLIADVSEVIFYPNDDFSEGMLHFNHLGSKNKNYTFMFNGGFDPGNIIYFYPENNTIEKLKDGTVKLSFTNTDHYSYIQRAFKDNFLVSEENGSYKILLNSADCKGDSRCETAENILTINVPKGYGVRKFQGLDQDMKTLKNPHWRIKGNAFTLTARDVKAACVMMEIEKLDSSQVIIPITIATSVPIQPAKLPEPSPPVNSLFNASVVPVSAVTVAAQAIVNPDPVAKVETKIEQPILVIASKPIVKKQGLLAHKPAPSFRNYQLFEYYLVKLSEEGKEHLRKWAKLFASSGKKSIIINSYTDDIPPQRLKAQYATNEIVSEARGRLVAEYLSTQGIDPSIITVNGMGDADPVAPNDTPEGRSKNRRVEFIIK